MITESKELLAAKMQREATTRLQKNGRNGYTGIHIFAFRYAEPHDPQIKKKFFGGDWKSETRNVVKD